MNEASILGRIGSQFTCGFCIASGLYKFYESEYSPVGKTVERGGNLSNHLQCVIHQPCGNNP